MTKRKLPPAKDWRARDIEDWNVATFCAYLTDKHREMFGVDYVPMRGWRAEQGILGRLIGTQSRTAPKPRTASNAAVKRFIDVTFESYKPSPEWPGVNFGWVWTYRKTDWQRIQAAELAQEQRKASVEEAPSLKELEEWW